VFVPLSPCPLVSLSDGHGAGGGRYPGGGRPLSQHGGGARLLEFEHDFRHPQPDSGSKVETAIKANSKRLVCIEELRRNYARHGGRYWWYLKERGE